MSYLWQATRGQLKLSSRMRPIDEVLRDPRTDAETKQVLGYVAGIKSFGESQGLKRTHNYEHFVRWDDEALVWVVSATPELSLENQIWHFPIVGDVPYMGFFERKRAQEFEADLKAQGLETYLRGAPAYSSLGYFQDPLVSTLWRPGEKDVQAVIAQTVLHESVHATLYLKSQSSLNESIAEFIASELTPLYLEHVGAVETKLRWEKRGERVEKLQERMSRAYGELEKVYINAALSDEAKRAQKSALLAQLSKDLETFGISPERALNNPVIAQYRTYHDAGPEWRRLWELCDKSPHRLLKTLEQQLSTRGDPQGEPASTRLTRWLEQIASCSLNH